MITHIQNANIDVPRHTLNLRFRSTMRSGTWHRKHLDPPLQDWIISQEFFLSHLSNKWADDSETIHHTCPKQPDIAETIPSSLSKTTSQLPRYPKQHHNFFVTQNNITTSSLPKTTSQLPRCPKQHPDFFVTQNNITNSSLAKTTYLSVCTIWNVER